MHDQDKQWVKKQINLLPRHLRGLASENYMEAFKEGSRSEANTRLRLYVQRVINGYK
jgi:hypothetical protein